MQNVALWRISSSPEAVQTPSRVNQSSIELEKHLEDWIEADPDLLELGLTIVGRQVYTVAGKVDLIGRDPQGNWVIIEVKRGQSTRDALAQAIDYASAIAELPAIDLETLVAKYPAASPKDKTPATQQEDSPAERQIRIILVGVGTEPALKRIVAFLSSKFQMPIAAVAFSVFRISETEHVLLRELSDSEGGVEGKVPATPSIEDQLRVAQANGIGEPFRQLIEAAEHVSLRRRIWKNSVMIAPPANATRSLFTVWNRPEEANKVTIWLGPEVFESFFGIPQERVTAILGPGGWRRLSTDEIHAFAEGLIALMAEIADQE